jgi:hypothetical protein
MLGMQREHIALLRHAPPCFVLIERVGLDKLGQVRAWKVVKSALRDEQHDFAASTHHSPPPQPNALQSCQEVLRQRGLLVCCAWPGDGGPPPFSPPQKQDGSTHVGVLCVQDAA